MAIIKKIMGQITLKVVVDVVSTTYYYLLMPSAAPIPAKPITSPPPTYEETGYEGWQTTEPGYTNGDTRSLYVTVRTVYSNGTFEYTTPSLSSSYEAAKQAYNRAQSAMTLAADTNNYFWWLTSSDDSDVPTGAYVTNIPKTTFMQNKTGGNVITQSTGITIRNGITQLASLTGQALNFYNPQAVQGQQALQLSIGANGTLQSGNYTRGSDSKFSSNGTKIDLINGDIITKYFRVSQGLETGLNAGVYVHGTIEALDGTIGTDSTNYWEIGNGTDYNLSSTAKMIGHGSSYIQLGDSSTWRLATNRVHTGWYITSDSLLHYPEINSKYWDFGLHTPAAATEKFLYIRKSKANTSASNVLTNLLYDIDDTYATPQWDYIFYVSADGSLYARNLYVLDENGNATQIGGTDGVYLLKSGGTMTGSITMSNGGKFIGDVTGNVSGSASKLSNTSIIGNTNKPVYFTANGVPAAISYEINKSVPSNAIFTDENVNTSQANTTKIYLTGTSTAGSSTGKLNFDSNVYLTTTAGTLHATTFEGNLSGTASRATADGDGNTIKTTYLKLSGGNVTGAVSFGSFVTADELTVGDLVVNGAASFTNNLQANTINGVMVGNSPKFTDTVTTVTTSGNGNAVTAITASNGKLTVTKGTTFLTSYTETDPIFVASAAHGITSTDISNWNSKTSNTGTVTSVRVQASSPLTSTTGTASSTTLDTTIKFANQNKNLVLAGPSSGDAAAPTFRSLVADDIPGLAWNKITSGKPTTLSGYGITDAAGLNALVGLSASSNSAGVTTFTATRASGTNPLSFEVSIVASAAAGANALRDSEGPISKGSVTKPVYFNNGVPAEANTYAGGTAVTLNNASKASSTASFYAPTSGGTTSQLLVGNGTTSAPTWKAISDIVPTKASTADAFSSAAEVKLTGDTTGSASSTKGWSITTKTDRISTVGDNRAAATTPNDYANKMIFQGLKTNSSFGSPSTDTYSYVVGLRGWSDSSGGDSHEFAFNNSGINHRSGATTSWGAWEKLVTSANYTDYTVTKTGTGASGTWGINISGSAPWSEITSKPTTVSGYGITDAILYGGVDTGLGSGTPAANAKAYYSNTAKVPVNSIKMFLNSSGAEYTSLFSNRGSYGSILKWGYIDRYIRILRNHSGTWKSDDWEKIDAGYADTAGTATKWASAQTVYVTLGTASTTTTIQGGNSSAQTIGVNGTLGVANGGTGKTTGIDAANYFLNSLTTGSSTPTDNDYYISQYVGGGTTTTTYHRRPMSALWNYIDGKISNSKKYVTIAGDSETITGTKVFNNLLGTKYVATKGGKGCEINYNSSLDAIVFSFA